MKSEVLYKKFGQKTGSNTKAIKTNSQTFTHLTNS